MHYKFMIYFIHIFSLKYLGRYCGHIQGDVNITGIQRYKYCVNVCLAICVHKFTICN
jgi:hypothetical protein